MSNSITFLGRTGMLAALALSLAACAGPDLPDAAKTVDTGESVTRMAEPDPRIAKWQATCGVFDTLIADIQAGSVTADQLIDRVSELDAAVEIDGTDEVIAGVKSLSEGVNAQDEAQLNTAASTVRAACSTWGSEIEADGATK